VDADGHVYIATALGVQVFDQIGKCHAIIPAPQRASLSNVEFGGPNLDELYVTTLEGHLYRVPNTGRTGILAAPGVRPFVGS
jgi:sugar lactone lactonase YvrE